MKRIIVFFCIAVFLAGCATAIVGRPIDQNAVSQIVRGQSTKADVIALLGSPDRITETDSFSRWTYHYARAASRFGGLDTQSQVVMIMFTKSGIVKTVTTSQHGMEINTGSAASGKVDQRDIEDNKRPK
jgi:outer membrane protein assembly factor BamE (lipoprotein component of BamABCDE complex)